MSKTLLERFRRLVEDDRRDGHLRPLEAYQRLFHGHDELIAREYARLARETPAPTPPAPVDPPSSTDTVLRKLAPADSGLKLEGEVARGGMGAIQKVRDDTLHRDLAMKVMLPERESEALYVHRFLEEAQVTAQLDHPGVVPVHQLGRDPNGRLYFTMKLVRGRTLSRIFDLVRAGKENWTNTRVIELFVRICETLAFAHLKGVVHRDLKPANIMVGDYGELYVMDWGLAKVLGARAEPTGHETPAPEPRSYVRTVRSGDAGSSSDSPAATIVGDVLGTPAYMPLEQALGRDLDARSDIYAVGAMLYELLAGHPPYGDKHREPSDIVIAVVAAAPAPLRKLAPKAPAEIIAICEKAMARDPADRYQNAGELAQELRNFIEGRVVRAYRTGAVVELRKWITRNKALAAAVGAAFLLLVAGAVTNRSLYREALREGERAKRQAYRAAIAAAASEIEGNNLDAAEARLDALPPRLRGWEWRYLRCRVDRSFADVPIPAFAFDARTGQVLGTERGKGLLACDVATGQVTEILPEDRLWKSGNGWLTPDGRYCMIRTEGGVGVLDRVTSQVVARGEGGLDPSQPWLHAGNRTIDLATGRDVPADAADALAEKLMEKSVAWQRTSVSPDRTKVCLVRDNTATVFDVATGNRVGDTVSMNGNILAAGWSRDSSRLAIGGWSAEVIVLDATAGRVHRAFHGQRSRIDRAAFSADGAWLVTSGGDGSQVWDVEGDPEPQVLKGHHSFVYPVAFSPDGQRILSGGWDGHVGQTGSLRIWDASTGQQVVQTIRVKTVWAAAFLADGKRLLVSLRTSDGLRLLDADTLREIRTYGDGSWFEPSPDGTRAVIKSGDVKVIDLDSGAVVAKLDGTDGGAAWNGRWIATGGQTPANGDLLVLWSPETFARERAFPAMRPVAYLDFEPNGRRIVVAGGRSGVADVYDTETGEHLASLPGHEELLVVRFSPDGSRILTAGRDAAIHVWDAESYEEVVQLRGHDAYVFSLDFSPDGKTLVSGSGDGTVRLWTTAPLGVQQRAIWERERLVAELKPRVLELFGELKEPASVVARLRSELSGRRREIALQLALAEAVARRGE